MLCDFAPPVGLKLDPSYTFNCDVEVSNHSSPLKGADGADVDADADDDAAVGFG